MKEQFKEVSFNAASLEKIEQVNSIISEYQEKGYRLTLRQLYYQFVARGLPNKQSEYKRLGDIVSKGRWAGKIDWSAIEDRTRNLEKLWPDDSPRDAIKGAAYGYREDLWRMGQDYYVEVWIEKEALVGVIDNVCRRWRVPYFACRGYNSDSEAYDAATRFKWQIRDGIRPVIFYLGDHDPSGIQMDADHYMRLGQLSGYEIEIRRLALTKEQVEEHRLPPNPVKKADSRSQSYELLHGGGCWELDALDPSIIAGLVRREIESVIDREEWDKGLAAEREVKDKLLAIAEDFDDDTSTKRKERGPIQIKRWDEAQAEMLADFRATLGIVVQPPKSPWSPPPGFVSYRR
jgi:hypothetical protein